MCWPRRIPPLLSNQPSAFTTGAFKPGDHGTIPAILKSGHYRQAAASAGSTRVQIHQASQLAPQPLVFLAQSMEVLDQVQRQGDCRPVQLEISFTI